MAATDMPQVYRIEQQAYSHPWSEKILRDCLNVGYSAWVLTQHQLLIAYGFLSVVADECHLLNLTVEPQRQRLGHGTRLLQHLLTRGRQAGAIHCFLEVRQSNIGAIRLYQQYGFRRIGQRKGYYPADIGREDALVMTLKLDNYPDVGGVVGAG